MKRRLVLQREALTELTPDDLTAVIGGVAATGNGLTCPGATTCLRELSLAPCTVQSVKPNCSWSCPTE
ncbi:MAG: hypothetical protein QOE45_2884 [Frankiaceae bacterium]|jgi:hypothetical protein|nr:hypothetical protein [Frankiaceae bacterium]